MKFQRPEWQLSGTNTSNVWEASDHAQKLATHFISQKDASIFNILGTEKTMADANTELDFSRKGSVTDC